MSPTPHSVALHKSIILTSFTVWIAPRLHVLWLNVYPPTTHPSVHDSHPVHTLILRLTSYDGQDALFCTRRQNYPCAQLITTPWRCMGGGGGGTVPPILDVMFEWFSFAVRLLYSFTCRESNTEPSVIWTCEPVTVTDQLYCALIKPIFLLSTYLTRHIVQQYSDSHILRSVATSHPPPHPPSN
jgi:hypothetical protein